MSMSTVTVSGSPTPTPTAGPSPASPTSWVASLRSQRWYAQVAQIMAAAGVPVYIWEAVLRDEDTSLNPAADVSDPTSTDPSARSYGLFQLNSDGVGAGQTPTDLEDPVQNAVLAANQMGTALRALPAGASPVDQMRAVEKSGWPGNDPVTIAQEEPTRMALLYKTLQEEGLPALADLVRSTLGAPGAGGSIFGGGTDDTQQKNFWGPLATTADDLTSGPLGWADLPAVIKGIERSSIVLAVGVALIAGGFALMRGGSSNG